MSYWDKSVNEQVKKLKAKHPLKSVKELKSLVIGSSIGYLTNPVRKRFSGAKEIARRKSQIEKGFIKVN